MRVYAQSYAYAYKIHTCVIECHRIPYLGMCHNQQNLFNLFCLNYSGGGGKAMGRVIIMIE